MEEQLLLSFADLESEHWWFVVRNRIADEAILSAAPSNTACIVEVGCGTGGHLRRLSEMFPHSRVRGIEPVASAVEHGRARGCEIDEGVLETLPFADESVDMLIALDVLEHCADDARAMAEVVRVLSPGGAFVSTVPALMSLWGPHDERNAHYRRYRLAQLERVIGDSGLHVERSTYFNTLLLPVGYASRVVARTTRSVAATGVDVPPKPINAALRTMFSVEVPLVRRVRLPVGMSLLCVAHKPATVSWRSGAGARTARRAEPAA